METVFSKVSVLQNGLSHTRLPIFFPNTILWLLPNMKQKRIPLNDNIVCAKIPEVVKDLSNSSTLSAPKYLGTKLFYSLYAQVSRIF